MEIIEKYQLQLLETAIIIAFLLLINFIFRKWSTRSTNKLHLAAERHKITIRIINAATILIGAITLAGIWGLNQEELFVFFTSTLTVLGIAFFAQWSILSNITSGILLFFNHPLHIGDTIKIIDKDLPVEGVLKDITVFFMHVETIDGEYITIPNSVVTQKIISITAKSKKRTALSDKPVKGSDIEEPI